MQGKEHLRAVMLPRTQMNILRPSWLPWKRKLNFRVLNPTPGQMQARKLPAYYFALGSQL
jgi:hypothetical protein